ncbi:deoxyribonuclease-1-like [Mercenaria mercenaria]|uniref:deoxyribonuclease-1-like n=1 Tax=Mercenaria mercenaria TaxID=6596 RepID=UPI00234EC9B6|nr:deoxyribonuclease-1-like [Mercenaria mercenaria]
MLLLQLLALLLVSDTVSARNLRVGAFNIQVFGVKKAKNTEVMDILIKIIRRYDLLLIQEIRDSTNTAIHYLLGRVNRGQTEPFEMVLSERLGRSNSKEQYAYFYRPAAGLQVQHSYTYHDTKEHGGTTVDLFERQPYIVSFSSSGTELVSFRLIGIHVDPDKAVEEINYLDKFVVSDVQNRPGPRELMILGDLNADCNYVSKRKWKKIPMKKDPRFNWLIGDEIDTTVKGSHCAYDRFIITGPGWQGGIVPDSAKVYRFDQDLNIDNKLAAKVSDHYPIEFLLSEKQYIIISISNRVYIKLLGDYKAKGSLPVNELYDLGVGNKNVHVISVYDKHQKLVGELKKETDGEKKLSEELFKLITADDSNLKMYIEPLKKRYADKQRSKVVIALPATHKQEATIIWNILQIVVCKYFKCEQ